MRVLWASGSGIVTSTDIWASSLKPTFFVSQRGFLSTSYHASDALAWVETPNPESRWEGDIGAKVAEELGNGGDATHGGSMGLGEAGTW